MTMPAADRLRRHWPEYLAECAGLAVFMCAASGFATLIEHPSLALRQIVDDPLARRALMGLAMGGTAIALIYSPLGARSGAHLNPATTLAFWRLGKLHGADAAAYVLAQVVGAFAGMLAATVTLDRYLAAPEVHYVATVPGPWGHLAAFAAEVVITFVLLTAVLHVSNHPRLSRFTGVVAGSLVALYITVEAPVSGMSLNPARSLAPAVLAAELGSFWIYLVAPPLGMLLAAVAFVSARGAGGVRCAKLHHHSAARCIFHCRFDEIADGDRRSARG
jgi:aquaporin Z